MDRPLWTSRRELLLDLLPIAVLLAIMVAYGFPGGIPDTPQRWLELGADVILLAAMLVRRRYPLTLMAAVTAVSAVTLVLGLTVPGVVLPVPDPLIPWTPVASTVVCYTVAAHVPHRVLTWVLVVALSVVAIRPWAPELNTIWGGILLIDVAAS